MDRLTAGSRFRSPDIGFVLIGIGAALWLGALAAVALDRVSSRRRRLLTLAILLVSVPVGVLYWLRSR